MFDFKSLLVFVTRLLGLPALLALLLSLNVQAQAPKSSPDRFQVSADGQEVLHSAASNSQLVRPLKQKHGEPCPGGESEGSEVSLTRSG